MLNQSIAGAGAALLLTLAGCGEPQRDTADDTNIEVAEGNYSERLQTMEEGQRNAVFIRAIRDAGFPCQGVQSSAYQGESNGVPTWTAQCEDDVQWVIMLGADGVAQVANAAELRAATPAEAQ